MGMDEVCACIPGVEKRRHKIQFSLRILEKSCQKVRVAACFFGKV